MNKISQGNYKHKLTVSRMSETIKNSYEEPEWIKILRKICIEIELEKENENKQ